MAGLRKLTPITSGDRTCLRPWMFSRFAGHPWCAGFSGYRARKAKANKKLPTAGVNEAWRGGAQDRAPGSRIHRHMEAGALQEGFAGGVALGSDSEKRMNVRPPGRGRRER